MKKHRIAVDEEHENRLGTYMREWGVMSSVFARRAGVGYAHLLRLRRGNAEPSRRVMVALADAASAMREKPVYVVELFELSPADEAIYQALISKGIR
jgi:transcriptional regulator with XRE-family HTH domain